ncbi:hypothetical protein FHR75_000357 [Kineococcus radiotolerans]|uniref:O-antigen polymerase n=1 Tax=Kineococcus radiotolerans TaxID=131568 RepID=A0A7W4XVV2_KINRA|nr:oligosaccharide repeat unit polymerase [Kineococcus radiotolerans]MBB2899569.1 hypothetical protein [Kineococcus radiotolerans]
MPGTPPSTRPHPAAPVRTDSSTAAVGTGVAVVLGAVVPLLVLGHTPDPGAADTLWRWAFAFAVVVGARLGWLVVAGPRRLFEVVFWIFVYVFLALAPLVQLRSGQHPGTTPRPHVELHGTALLAVVAGTAAVAVGVAVGRRRRAPAVLGDVPPRRAALLAVAALLLFGYYTWKTGLPAMFAARDARSAAALQAWPDPAVNAVVRSLATFPLVVAFVALVRVPARRGLLLLVAVAVVVSMNPISSPRYVAGTAALSVVVALGAMATTARARAFGLGFVAALLLLYPVADAARRVVAEVDTRGALPPTLDVMTSGDFDAFEQITNAVWYVRELGSTDGRQLLGTVLFWVPRAVWPDKPTDTGILLADAREYRFDNLSAPLWGELLVNGGFLLLVAGMLVLGYVIARADAGADLGFRSGRRPVLAVILPFYFVILLRGSLLQAMAGLVVILACGLFVDRLHRARPPSRHLR